MNYCNGLIHYLAKHSGTKGSQVGLSKQQATAQYCESQKLGILPNSGIPHVANPFILIRLPHLQIKLPLSQVRSGPVCGPRWVQSAGDRAAGLV